jgi:GH18 family chitinase
MTRPRLRASLATATVAAALALGGAVGMAAAATPIPAHVYAPYFETWTGDTINGTATQSGARYFTLAFLETTGKTSCTLAWNGSKSQTLNGTSSPYFADIASLRSIGGDVLPSFGGWSADQGGTEIGDSCKSVDQIAAAYEQVVTTYEVSRLDMDIEGKSLTRADGIDRRNKAIKKLQDWAAANGRTVQVQYTLPTSRSGLEASGLAVLQNALANNVRIDLVNPMVFDYYDRATGAAADMGESAKSALTGLHAQLATLYGSSKTSAQLWAMTGATIMNGLDDYPRRTEVTTVQDAIDLRTFAQTNGMSALSMWAIQRDNGGCAGTTGANNCSGITQQTWEFTSNLKGFTGP